MSQIIIEQPTKYRCKRAGAEHMTRQYLSPIVTNYILFGFVIFQESLEFLGVLSNGLKSIHLCTNEAWFAIGRTKVKVCNTSHKIRPIFFFVESARTLA